MMPKYDTCVPEWVKSIDLYDPYIDCSFRIVEAVQIKDNVRTVLPRWLRRTLYTIPWPLSWLCWIDDWVNAFCKKHDLFQRIVDRTLVDGEGRYCSAVDCADPVTPETLKRREEAIAYWDSPEGKAQMAEWSSDA
jgi:hypothetical protein